ncbi:uncharacterized protein PGTG_15640 [Puccinia graminis f. sp. tritici CRL 75-36-700-3]|uniref:Phospholipase/carboxylesterase/thioesterase domain-containing protein n=1 Tax=Puccinia graminis f. sp. tritici (strain CRL 75-36-700-3 / race SCCL) TaxID=418459 RepID=E3KZF2_PUCGT|nr:uncharacterized protein PGTG_15640 [Puccinia graminis f. sp. tritici CRL 75-36-700-3]EFP89677.1 hypothetical protein PGTG_15640 [Puccinia graminis f. sp. tritici CRL 75-36-700-3]
MNLHLHPPTASRSAATKPAPSFPQLSPAPVFDYHPSADGIDSNLLIFFHGLGDTQIPFSQLARKLKLPQTACMSIRAFERVPFLEEEAYQWWESFDITGSPVSHPNPSSTLIKLIGMLDRLTTDEIGWTPEDIHLFGFAQGASCLSELALLWTRSRSTAAPLASIVSVSGPLLSLPTIPTSSRSPTPVFLWTRRGEDDTGKWRAGFERGFQSVQHFLAPRASQEQMPMTPQEWKPILEFWSKLLKSRHPWELNDRNTEESSTYEVRAG